MESESNQTMKFGDFFRSTGRSLKAVGLVVALLAAPQVLHAQNIQGNSQGQNAPVAPAPVSGPEAAGATTPATPAATVPDQAAATPAPAPAPVALTPEQIARTKVAPGGYTPMKPTPGIGMPVDGGMGLQKQFAPLARYAQWIHDDILTPLILVITVFVLGLLLWVIVRYNKRANPVPSRTSHNTTIEIVWTLVPVLILVAIAIPSIDLLAKQYNPAPAKALTIKATGYQWYWGYSYPDNGGFEVISNMLPEAEATKRGEPAQLAADYRMVVPVGEQIRLQVTGADVIHAFGVPSLWFKIDAVPGRINERVFTVDTPGVYYGQCYELCGARHGYMPIVVEALPRDKFNAWVLAQAGGKLDGLPEAPPPAPAATTLAPSPAKLAPPATPAAATPAAASSATPAA
jgi:cytochrome c oxidase subunit 2